jgi:outer membrane protein assembly factor BamB
MGGALKFTWLLVVSLLIVSVIPSGFGGSAQSPARAKSGSDWADWRGPSRDGISPERNLPEKWSPQGENLLWKAPYGGRSGPIVMSGRLFLLNTAGEGETLQERVLCLDAESGRKIWEYRFNLYSTDSPPHRVAWSSPVGDPSTGKIYAYGNTDQLVALSFDGKLLWVRSLTDEYGAWTTYGARTVSPIIEGDLVIVSAVTDGFADLSLRRHRYYAFDKRSGECVWITALPGRPADTSHSTPVAATIDGARLLLAGGSDGAVYGIKANTGEVVWSYPMSKRFINTSVVMKGKIAFVSHQQENIETSETGHLAAIDAAAQGLIGKDSNQDRIRWAITKYRLGPSSPVIDGDRLYQLDVGATLFAFALDSGKNLWEKHLGTTQKASPVFADGKIYVGTENGRFYILKPGATGCEVLDQDDLEPIDKVDTRTEAGDEVIFSNERIIGSAAVYRGRVYLVSTKRVYAIGKKRNPALPPVVEKTEAARADTSVAQVQIVPVDLVMKPGETARFKVRLFDDHGRFIREESNVTFTHEGLKGSSHNNRFTPDDNVGRQVGTLKATVGGVTGISRIRVIQPMPFVEDFTDVPLDAAPPYWLNTAGKYAVREVGGNRVLVKKTDNPAFKRTRSHFGPVDWSNYTVEAEIRAVEKRRQMGDAGIVAQRYDLVLFGNSQKLELRSWQIQPQRRFDREFAWNPDAWYRLKLEVENLPGGKTRARGKAWLAAETEPAEWTIEWTDPIGNRNGSAGVFADSATEVYFDNIKVRQNKREP